MIELYSISDGYEVLRRATCEDPSMRTYYALRSYSVSGFLLTKTISAVLIGKATAESHDGQELTILHCLSTQPYLRLLIVFASTPNRP